VAGLVRIWNIDERSDKSCYWQVMVIKRRIAHHLSGALPILVLAYYNPKNKIIYYLIADLEEYPCVLSTLKR